MFAVQMNVSFVSFQYRDLKVFTLQSLKHCLKMGGAAPFVPILVVTPPKISKQNSQNGHGQNVNICTLDFFIMNNKLLLTEDYGFRVLVRLVVLLQPEMSNKG